MTELQTKLLEMLKFFHGFCEKNGIKYYALGGTMLGAVRHGGFIPWDDDIDVGLPREDYEKFIALAQNLPKPYVLETPDSSAKEFVYAFSKLYDTDTTFVEKGKRNVKRGIYLDIFPLDGLGNDEKTAKAQFKKTARLVKILAVRVSPVRKGRGFLKNFAVVLARLIPQFIINDKKLAKKLNAVAAQIPYKGSTFVGNIVFNYKDNNILPSQFFGTPKPYKFEDSTIMGAEDYEGYLTYVFGDWRKLPPEEQQVSLHLNKEINLHKSYLDKEN